MEKPLVKRIRTSGQSLLIILGGLIIILWLIYTPSGVFGKVDAIGYAVCHRIDVRSFHIGLTQLPLCARCTGQYVGAIIGLILLGLFGRKRSGFPSKHVIIVLILLILIYAVDGLNSYLYLPPFTKLFPNMPHLYHPSNALRLFTGTGMGLVIAILLYPAFIGSIIANPDQRPAIPNFTILFILLGIGVMADLFILTESTYVLFPAALMSVAGVVLILTLVYTTIWIRILHNENTYIKPAQMLLPLTCGFVITFAQLGVLDLIRYIITGTWNGWLFG